MLKKVLVTGGGGYKGHILAPKLLAKGYEVVIHDLFLFGNFLPPHPKLHFVKADLRDIEPFKAAVKGCDAVIHMGCISNDASFELDSNLSKSMNYDCFEPLVVASKEAGVKRFINISSSSVYGVSDAPDVTEEHPLLPLTEYNKFKGLCEPLLWKHQSNDFVCVTIRPATVCGYSPRMRFDLTVNILTNHAYNKGLITVFGGAQKRPNIHIEDVTDLYVELLEMPAAKIAGETFNAGYENFTVSQLAEFVKKIVEEVFPEKAPINITTTTSEDNRSYHVSSQKIADKLGWKPKHSIEDAVRDVCQAFKDGRFVHSMTNEMYYNIKTVKSLGLK
jgi:nucleoside-diphosphate-sugar epimerase